MASFNPTEERHIKTLKSGDFFGGDAQDAQKRSAKQPVLVVKCGENVVCFVLMLVDFLSTLS